MTFLSSIKNQFSKYMHNHEDFNNYKAAAAEASKGLHRLCENNPKIDNDTLNDLNLLIEALEKKNPNVMDLKRIENSKQIIKNIQEHVKHKTPVNHDSLRSCAGKILEEEHGVISKDSQFKAHFFIIEGGGMENVERLLPELSSKKYENKFPEVGASLLIMQDSIKKISKGECPTEEELNAMIRAPELVYEKIITGHNSEWESKNQDLMQYSTHLWNNHGIDNPNDGIIVIDKLAKRLLERLPEKAFKSQEHHADDNSSPEIIAIS